MAPQQDLQPFTGRLVEVNAEAVRPFVRAEAALRVRANSRANVILPAPGRPHMSSKVGGGGIAR
jgi:hypothetical protein